MSYDDLIFRVHAIQRMFERGISEIDVRDVLENGEVIQDYPNELPYSTRLVLGFCGRRPVHVLAADARDANATIIITVYEPDPLKWDPTFKRRR